MSSLADFILRVRRAIDDVPEVGEDPFYSDELLTDGIQAGHHAVLPWHPKLAEHVFTSGSAGEVSSFALPSDFYAIDGLRDDDNDKLLPSMQMRAQSYVGEDVTGNEFYMYPSGYITLAKAPSSGDTFTMYYRAYWEIPTVSSGPGSEMEIHDHLEDAIIWYCCAYLLTPEGVSSASIRQWNTRADSGNPEHNPVAQRSSFFLRLFQEAVTRHKAHIPGEI